MNSSTNQLQSNVYNIFQTLSFYSPIITCVSIIVFSMLSSSIVKALIFFLWIFVITFLRIIVFKGFDKGLNDAQKYNEICSTGLTQIFIPRDVTYSTYILSFTLAYLVVPMAIISLQKNVNIVNYGILAFFIAYIALDITVKSNLACITGVFSKLVIGDILSGIFLGTCISGIIMYSTTLKKYLYINETNRRAEVCTMPTKQTYRCNVYKNGELVA